MAFSQRPAVVNAHAQAQARVILKRTRTPTTEWPAFDLNLDERLHHIAHRLIWGALELLETGVFEDEARGCMVKGAEALEFLYADSAMPAILRTEELLKASFAYYISGYSARAFVLLNDMLDDLLPLPTMLQLAVAVLQRDLIHARHLFVSVFDEDTFGDEAIAHELTAGNASDIDAISRIITRATASAVCCFLEFIKSGDRLCCNEALELIQNAVDLARECQFVDLWWWAFCIRFLFRELDNNSFWTQLAPLTGDDAPDGLARRYIRAGLRQSPPVIDLWPSQKTALPTIVDNDRPDFCLRMPTSSGKTRIAELTILQFLMDYQEDPEAKCVYIAPFRSLAVEIEKSLKRAIEPLGERISEVYGGFELSPAERMEVADNRVLVATPEKFDALLRFVPELADQIRLLIFDEGHIVDPNERGLRFEFLIQRSIKRFRPNGCRFLFISAVLPNAEQFAEWITSARENLVTSQWRPSRLMIGRLNWDGNHVGVSYTHRGQEALQQECFIRRFVDSRECKGVPGLGRRRKPFPCDLREAMAAAALVFAQDGSTLVFVPQARLAKSAAKDLRDALDRMDHLAVEEGTTFSLPIPGKNTDAWQRCKQVIAEEMGDDSDLLDYFAHGIVLHHAQLPKRVRLAIEEAIREGATRIIVATTTLGQGVNLPIKTVVVRGLYHGHGDIVSPLTFWNVCGRAGRAMKENEGQVLFCCDQTDTPPKKRKRDRAIQTVIQTLQSTIVKSALRLALQMIVHYWRDVHGNTDVAALSLRLAENETSWLTQDNGRERLEDWLDILDGHLLTLAEEFDLDGASPDRLQKLLEGSLLFLQLRDQPSPELNSEGAVTLLQSRMRYVCSRIPDRTQRTRMYKLGMTLSSCLFVEEQRDDLAATLLDASDWDNWADQQRAEFLLTLADVLLEIRDIRPDSLPDETNLIIRLWLLGHRAAEIATHADVHGFSNDPSKIALFIENVCGYRIPWAANSVLAYVAEHTADPESALPDVCNYISALFKYGLVSPTASCIMPRVDHRRNLAVPAANACPHHYSTPERVIAWFMNVSDDELVEGGVDVATAKEILEERKQQELIRTATVSQRRRESICLRIRNADLPQDVDRLRRLLIHVDENESRRIHAYSLSGAKLGQFRFSAPRPTWWRRGDLLESVVTALESTEKRLTMTIELREL